MIILVLLTALAALPGLRILPKNRLHGGLTRKNTLAVYGIFSFIIMISHASYSYDMIYLFQTFPRAAYFFDQLTVAPFFLFSGYGMALSIQTKPDYAMRIPKHKILKTYLHFAASNGLMILLACAAGEPPQAKTRLLSFLTFAKPMASRLGNCSWFVFILLCLYLFVFLSRVIMGKNQRAITAMTAVFCVLFYFLLRFFNAPTFYHNTLLLFPCGMLCYRCRKLPQKVFSKKPWLLAAIFSALVALTVIAEKFYRSTVKDGLFLLALGGLSGAMLLFLMKIDLNNRFFIFCGKHSFELYLLQGIPMKLLEMCESVINPWIYRKFPLLQPLFVNEIKLLPSLYTVLAIAMSLAVAIAFRRFTDQADRWIFRQKPKKSLVSQQESAEKIPTLCP